MFGKAAITLGIGPHSSVLLSPIQLQTRMLAINVSIPSLTVARLEQFRSPQLRIQRGDQQT